MPSNFTIDLPDLDALFITQSDPFQPHYRSQPGLEELLHDIRTAPRSQVLSIVVRVPKGGVRQDELPLETAIRNYCDQEIRLAHASLHHISVDGRASLGRGVVFLGICFTLSRLFTEIDLPYSILNYVFTEGMSIAGWVALWNPFDTLLFSRGPYRRRIKALERMQAATWRVEEVEGNVSRRLPLAAGAAA